MQSSAEIAIQHARVKDQAAKDPRLAQVRELTDSIVELKMHGGDSKELERLIAERDSLKAQIFDDVSKLAGQHRDALARERETDEAAQTATFEQLTDEALEAEFHSVSEQQRAAKRRKRLLRIALDARRAKRKVKDEVASMSAAEREALLQELKLTIELDAEVGEPLKL